MSYNIPNYSPTINPGDTRRRIWKNENRNILNGVPIALMWEQDVIQLASGIEKVLEDYNTPLSHVPSNPNEVIELRSIADDCLLGTTTLGVIHTMVYSLGRHMQKLRDQNEIDKIAAAEAARIAAEAAAEATRIAAEAAANNPPEPEPEP